MALEPTDEQLAKSRKKLDGMLGDSAIDMAYINERHQRAMDHKYGNYKFAILNAIPHEYAATQRIFGAQTKVGVNRDRLSYDLAVLQKANGSALNVIVAGVGGQGITQTAAAIGALAQRLPYLDTILLIGIAAGQPNVASSEKDVWLGDIVVSEAVVQYDHVRRVDGKDTCRGTNLPTPSPDLLGMARRLKAEMEGADASQPWSWEKQIEVGSTMVNNSQRPAADLDKNASERTYAFPDIFRRSADRPHLHIGMIGSANILLKDAKYRDQIYEEHKTLAYEMEGAGVAITAPQFNAQYIVVRGVCDYGDERKNDVWQRYASVAAASFGKVLLEQL